MRETSQTFFSASTHIQERRRTKETVDIVLPTGLCTSNTQRTDGKVLGDELAVPDPLKKR